MSDEQANVQESTQPHTSPPGYVSWNEYWTKEYNQPWRTEREIDEERRRFLAERRAIQPDIEKGIYPFRYENGSIRLSRADVEWLLATHESGRMNGPVDWGDATQQSREGLDLRGADLRGAVLRGLPLSRMRGGLRTLERMNTTQEQRKMAGVRLDGVDARGASLEQANLGWAHLGGINLFKAQLQQSYLDYAHLEAANLVRASLAGASLRHVFLDLNSFVGSVNLYDKVHGAAELGGIHWGEADLSVVTWSQLKIIGEEQEARKRVFYTGKKKSRGIRLEQFKRAVQANRQLAIALRGQGLNEHADRYAYRAQVCQRRVLRLQRHNLRAFGSGLLDLVSGFGYRPLRSFVTYLLVVGVFAVIYYLLGNNVRPPLDPLGAFVFSITSFHGRGFTPGENVAITNPITVLAAIEAVIGLLIEITFIATFTQRFFAR